MSPIADGMCCVVSELPADSAEMELLDVMEVAREKSL